MIVDHVVPATGGDLINTATGELMHYRIVDEAHPPKVEFLEVDMPDGTKARAMCLGTKEGYAVFFQGLKRE